MSFSQTHTAGGRVRRSIRQNDKVQRQVMKSSQLRDRVKFIGIILPAASTATPSSTDHTSARWSVPTSSGSGVKDGVATTLTEYRSTSTLSELPSDQTSRPSHRYKLRNCPPSESVTPWTLEADPETECPMLLDNDHRPRKKARPVEEISPEIKQLRKIITSQKIIISSLNRRLAAAKKCRTRCETQRLRIKELQESQQKQSWELQRASEASDKKYKELEKVNQQLVFQKGIDDEVRDLLMTQHEEYRKFWDVTKGKWLANKLEEIKKDMECEVVISKVTNKGSERVVDLGGIHISMMSHLKTLKDQSKQVKVTKIEYILSDELHKAFKNAKTKLREAGRSTDEVILFHGTENKNIETIVSEGFQIGGIDGFRASHGSSMGNGVYCCTEAQNTMFYQCTYGDPNPATVGTRRILGLRVLPGTTSSTYLFGKPKEIGVEEFDSHHSGCGIYVVRRACQTLPCFIVYY